jgi:hypothetical protein
MSRLWPAGLSALSLLLSLSACVSALPSAQPGARLAADEMPGAAPADDGAAPPPMPPAAAAAAPAAAAAAAPPLSGRPPARRDSVSPPPPAPPPLTPDQAVEEVVVRPDTVTGFWRLTASRSVDVEVGLFSGVQIHYGGELRDRNICWLQQSGRRLSATCSSGVALKAAEGSVEDDRLTLRWWVGPATIIYSGKLTEAARVEGGFSGGVIGLSVTGDVPASMTRLAPLPMTAAPAPDPDQSTAPLLRLVWQDVARGALSDGLYEAAAIKRVNQGLTRDMAVEPPRSLAFLGQILIRWRPEQREIVEDVYQVETASRRLLCRIAASAKGQVSDLNCNILPPL